MSSLRKKIVSCRHTDAGGLYKNNNAFDENYQAVELKQTISECKAYLSYGLSQYKYYSLGIYGIDPSMLVYHKEAKQEQKQYAKKHKFLLVKAYFENMKEEVLQFISPSEWSDLWRKVFAKKIKKREPLKNIVVSSNLIDQLYMARRLKLDNVQKEKEGGYQRPEDDNLAIFCREINKKIWKLKVPEILALKIYTDYDKYQSEAKKAYRFCDSYEDRVKAVNLYSKHYHWFQNLLAACLKGKTFKELLADNINGSEFKNKFYTGLDDRTLYIAPGTFNLTGPLSLTTNLSTAKGFASDNGQLIQWTLPDTSKTVYTSWLSSFPNEDEYLLYDTVLFADKCTIFEQNLYNNSYILNQLSKKNCDAVKYLDAAADGLIINFSNLDVKYVSTISTIISQVSERELSIDSHNENKKNQEIVEIYKSDKNGLYKYAVEFHFCKEILVNNVFLEIFMTDSLDFSTKNCKLFKEVFPRLSRITVYSGNWTEDKQSNFISAMQKQYSSKTNIEFE
ncbi:MAG: hypothetical protein GY730_00910 [bacterium]|nr:hypothetical protein [bacterium]